MPVGYTAEVELLRREVGVNERRMSQLLQVEAVLHVYGDNCLIQPDDP